MSNARNIADITNGDDAPVYACRAWVNFDGGNANSSFTEANGGIRSQGNVDSVTNTATGRFRVNFSTDMPDRNYAVTVSCYGDSSGGKNASVCTGSTQTETGDSAFQTGYLDLTVTVDNGSTKVDLPVISVAIFK